MHSGQFDTLADVIEFYDDGGQGPSGGASGTRDALLVPLQLNDDEKADLLAFLMTLNGQSIPGALRVDTSAP
jgi:cytochrome c peroxidase